MPKGPQSQNRPADVIGKAGRVARIATGEEEETPSPVVSPGAALSKFGGEARARNLTPERKAEIAKNAPLHPGDGRWRD
jgi:hypothetical protein